MNKSQQMLSDIVVYNKYARYIKSLGRRETWDEIVSRYEEMMVERYPMLKSEIETNIQYIRHRKVLPSMRALQFGGEAMAKNEARGYNCSYLPIDHYNAFSEVLQLLLGGTGVGYSVQKHHVDQLPEIRKPVGERKFLIGDSIEAWSDAIKALMKSYFGYTKTKPRFDFSDIRPKGSRLVTAGGKAPGPEPLKKCLFEVELILDKKADNSKLTPLECHDILCHLADAVLAGGIRRAAMISLFSADDDEMRTCKHGSWWELSPMRGRANNSATLLRHKITKEFFDNLWDQIKESGSGEPGIYFTNDKEYGSNPCVEVALRPFTFCNLTELNVGNLESESDFRERCKVASFFGTLQAGFTDFHYLRPIWKRNSEKDSLIGVGMTGICNGRILKLRDKNPNILKEGAEVVNTENERVSDIIGINKAARTCVIKPSGTTSCVLGTSSGIHSWHSKYYIRNIQCAVGDDLYNYFTEYHPSLIKVMEYDKTSAVIGVPQKAPDDAILRDDEDVIKMLERVKTFNLEWVHEGFRSGQNHNNVSATVSIKDDEWGKVGDWMWNNKNNYNGLSVLPYDGGSYKNAPFEECTEEHYNKVVDYINSNPIDLTKIIEEEDNTSHNQQIACAGGACEII